jgi:hypothetical protein
MSELSDILLAASLVIGGHEMNHKLEADKQDMPFSQRGITGYLPDTSNKKKVSRFANAGFEGQDVITRILKKSKLKRPAHAASGLNKLGYVLIPGSITGGDGDLRMLEKSKGKKARKVAQGALTISAISDLYKAFGKENKNGGFLFGQSSEGTPMLILTGEF